MLKGTISLLIIVGIIWVFWISWHWFRNPKFIKTKKQFKNKSNNNL